MVPEVVSALVKGDRKRTDIPIVLKQTPEMSIFDLMRAVPMYIEAEISVITLGHCFMTVVTPDIYNRGGRHPLEWKRQPGEPQMDHGTGLPVIGMLRWSENTSPCWIPLPVEDRLLLNNVLRL